MEIAVFTEDPRGSDAEAVDVAPAIWHAVVGSEGVPEFQLFRDGQDGVHVMKDSGVLLMDKAIWVSVRDSEGRWRSRAIILGDLAAGYVFGDPGRMPWDEYMAMPDADFGC